MYTLVQITDTHLFSHPGGRLGDVDVDQTLDQVVDCVLRLKPVPDLVLATGDFVQEETSDAYARVKRYFHRLPAPVICLPGNHDDPGLLDDICDGVHIRRPRHHAIGRWQVILLDSSRPGDDPCGHLATPELRALENHLSQSPDRPTLVCLHHPPVPIDSAWLDTMMVDNAADLLDLIRANGQVRAVVFGHVHQIVDRQIDGTRFLAAPSTCVQFTPGTKAVEYDRLGPGYRWFRLSDDGALETGVQRVND